MARISEGPLRGIGNGVRVSWMLRLKFAAHAFRHYICWVRRK